MLPLLINVLGTKVSNTLKVYLFVLQENNVEDKRFLISKYDQKYDNIPEFKQFFDDF